MGKWPVVSPVAVPLMVAAVVFVVMVPWGAALSRLLLRWGIGKRIRSDGPQGHQLKSGTPTMGGILFLAPIAVVLLGLIVTGHNQMWLPLFVLVAYGAMGAYDDLAGVRDRRGVGWLARHKFPWQVGVGLVAGLVLYFGLGLRTARLPGTDMVWNLGWAYIPLAALIMAGTVNAVNLADGLDGLAGGTSVLAVAAFGVIVAWESLCPGQAILNGVDAVSLSTLAFAMVGGIAAFLWHNVHPARMFMGDIGSLTVGGLLSLMALMSGWWLVLPVIGVVFVAEAASDIVQVGYFKYTRRRYGEGRRILRMAPLHHHFELSGWPEVQITQRIWLVGLIGALLGIAIALL